MKTFIDGDQLVIVDDDFENLQESPATFIPLDSDMAQAILAGDKNAHEALVDYAEETLAEDATE